MKADSPFLIFPWQRPFLSALKDRVMADTGGKPGKALIIVPNERPWQYFRHLFEADRKAVILPKMITGRAAAAIWRRHCCGPAAEATILDQVYYLHRCVREMGETESLLAAMFGNMEMARFLPWGIRLARLLDEIFQQHILPPNIAVAEGDLHRYAIALLGSLADISARWREALQTHCLTTPGFDAWQACEHLDVIPPELLPGRPVYIAGFSVLSAGEELLFHTLWQHGAQMCFQGDPALVGGENVDPACQPILTLMNRWHATGVLACDAPERRPEYAFFSAYDGHSQLERLVEDRRAEDGGTAAIVLLNTELLSPALHHLEDKNVNISMGYPLARAPLCGLLRNIFQLLMGRLPDGRYYWRDVDLLLHHPLIGMLRQGGDDTFRQKALPLLGRILRGEEEGAEPGRYVNPDELLAIARLRLPSWCFVVLRLGSLFLEQLARARTPGQLAALLGAFCAYIGRKALLLPREENVGGERQFPLDTEALCRLQDNVLPALGRNALAEERFSLATLRDMLHILVEQERIPFRAFPLLGTQVLGMLETRLLQFDHVYILDASDDFLPGRKAQDPLLPDNLRGLIGLPQRLTRQRVVAYNLARLCAGAATVNFYWSQGQLPGSLEQGKKSRSRFVEQMIWKLEEEKGQLLQPGEGPLRGARSRAVIHRGVPRAIPRLAALGEKLQKLLSGRLSAAMLNSYMGCPAKFAYQYLLDLNVSREVNEGEDPLAVGDCVHAVLRDLYEPLLETGVPDDREARWRYLEQNLDRIFQRQVEQGKLASRLPVFSWLYFEKAAPRRIEAYFLDQPAGCHPVCLEREMQTQIQLGHETYAFRGRVDRIDRRDGKFVILDYKTGSPGAVADALWSEEELFQALDGCQSAEDFAMRGDALLEGLRERLTDMQLPIYLLMAAQELNGDIANAAHVWLRKSGGDQEALFWPSELEQDVGLRRCASCVAFVVRHLRHCRIFTPRPENCDYCDYREACHTADLTPASKGVESFSS